MRDINNQYSKPAMRKCKSISSIVLHLETKETLVCRSIIAIEGLRFLASLPLAGTGRTEGGEKTQPFNRFHSRLFIRLLVHIFADPCPTSFVFSYAQSVTCNRISMRRESLCRSSKGDLRAAELHYPFWGKPREVPAEIFILQDRIRPFAFAT